MIAFEVSGEFLDLTPDFAVPIEWESSLFSDEFVLNGISTLPIALPFTAKNKRLLQYFHIVENDLRNLQLDCKLFLANNLWCTGQLTVAVKGESFDCDFSEVTSFAQDGDKKLADLFTDDDFYYLINPYKRWWAFNFSISLGASFLRLDVYVNGILHRFDSDAIGSAPLETLVDQIYTALIGDTEITSKFNITRITGAPTFEEIIYVEDVRVGVISQTDNYNIVCAWLLNSVAYGDPVDWVGYQKNLIQTALDALVNTDFENSNFSFPIIKNPEFYGDKNTDFTSSNKLINNYEEGYLLNSYAVKYKFSISPQLFLFAILTKIAQKYGAAVDGTLKQIEDIYKRCFVYNNCSIDLVAIDGYYSASYTGVGDVFNVFNGKIFIKDHLPDVTLKEFLGTIKNYLCSGIFYRNNILTIDTCKSILQNTEVIDWTNKQFRIYNELKGCFEDGYLLKYSPDGTDSYLSEKVKPTSRAISGEVDTFADLPLNARSGTYYIVKDEKAIYISKGANLVSNISVVTWSFFSNYLHDFIVGNKKAEINSNSSQTINDWHINLARKIYVPHIFQPGSSYEYELGLNPIPTRLLLFWGSVYGQIRHGGSDEDPEFISSTDSSVAYPFASMDCFDPDGVRIGDNSLRFDDQNGLYEKLYKEWLAFIGNAKKLTIKILLFEPELLQIQLNKKVQLGSNQFLISKIASSITANSTKVECLIDMYKL
jgi:hypothetical protein